MYVQPITPLSYRRRSRRANLGIVLDERITPIFARYPTPILRPFPLPGPPRLVIPPVSESPAPAPTTTTTQTPSGTPTTGMCVVESSPETGGVTSIVPCANVGPNRGGTVSPVNPANPQTFAPTTPVPSNYPTTQPFYAPDGSVWTYSSTAGQWQESQVPGSGSFYGSALSPVPAGYPTTQPYFASDGGVWNWNPTTGTWVETQLPGSAAAALIANQAGAAAPSVSVNASTPVAPSSYQAIFDWFNEDTVISGVKNLWIVAAAGAAYLFLKNRGAGRR